MKRNLPNKHLTALQLRTFLMNTPQPDRRSLDLLDVHGTMYTVTGFGIDTSVRGDILVKEYVIDYIDKTDPRTWIIRNTDGHKKHCGTSQLFGMFDVKVPEDVKEMLISKFHKKIEVKPKTGTSFFLSSIPIETLESFSKELNRLKTETKKLVFAAKTPAGKNSYKDMSRAYTDALRKVETFKSLLNRSDVEGWTHLRIV